MNATFDQNIATDLVVIEKFLLSLPPDLGHAAQIAAYLCGLEAASNLRHVALRSQCLPQSTVMSKKLLLCP